MTPIQEPQEIEIPRDVVAEASAPLPVIQFPDGSTEPAPAGSVKAEDIIGLITSEQIEELEAAKIGGKLTAEQIEDVHAASIIGEIINSQIKGMGVGKLEGQVTAAQIAANSITAEKIAVGAVITEKIAAGAITTGKLAAEAITAEKISASAITTSKIAAGAITVEKLTVVELSGITPKLGTITDGTLKSVVVEVGELNKEECILNKYGLNFKTGEKEINTISWSPEPSNPSFNVGGIFVNEQGPPNSSDIMKIWSGINRENAVITLQTIAEGHPEGNYLSIKAGKEGASQFTNSIRARLSGDASEATILAAGQRSSFVQTAVFGNVQMVAGLVQNNGSIIYGTGYTPSHTGVGTYRIAFHTAFPAGFAVCVSDAQLAGINATYATLSGSEIEVTMFDSATKNLENCAFSFIAIGAV